MDWPVCDLQVFNLVLNCNLIYPSKIAKSISIFDASNMRWTGHMWWYYFICPNWSLHGLRHTFIIIWVSYSRFCANCQTNKLKKWTKGVACWMAMGICKNATIFTEIFEPSTDKVLFICDTDVQNSFEGNYKYWWIISQVCIWFFLFLFLLNHYLICFLGITFSGC